MSSYWRNGPVLFNAMSGVDMVLWDIKGKRANMPVYQLLGGKCRFAAALYAHVRGRDFQEVENNARQAMAKGYRHIRVQVAIPGLATYGTAPERSEPAGAEVLGPTNPKYIWEPGPYLRTLPKLFEHLRSSLGNEVELLHDVHERITPSQAVALCKELEKYRLFFLEDPLPPEEKDHFRIIRQQSSVPLAMGELFNTQQEYVPLIAERLDRLHPHSYLADRRPEHGAKGGRPVRILRRENRLARPRRLLARGTRRGPCTRAGQPQFRNSRRLCVSSPHSRGLSRLPGDEGWLHVRE